MTAAAMQIADMKVWAHRSWRVQGINYTSIEHLVPRAPRNAAHRSANSASGLGEKLGVVDALNEQRMAQHAETGTITAGFCPIGGFGCALPKRGADPMPGFPAS